MRGRFGAFLVCVIVILAASLTLASAAQAFAADTAPLPTISSDKADYAPGELVTLSGAYWAPGESVHIVVNDDDGRSWKREVDVVADAGGQISDQFNLPDWFVAVYSVTASGVSGTATTSFTDGNFTIGIATADTVTPSSWSVAYAIYGKGSGPDTTCSGAVQSTGTLTGGGNIGIGPNESAKVTGITVSGATFGYWSSTASSTTAVTTGCVAGGSGTVGQLYAHFKPSDSTAPTSSASATKATTPTASAYTFGNWSNKDVTVTLSAADNTGGSGVKEIRYTTDATDPTASSGTVYSGPFTLSAEGTTTVRFRAIDNAGNIEAVQSRSVKIDKTAPIVGAASAVELNADGTSAGAYTAGEWTNKDVRVSWNCDDSTGGSGAVKASDSQTVSSEGAGGSVTPSCADVAENNASGLAFSPIMIDKTAPSVTVSLDRVADKNGWYNAPVGYGVSAKSDAASGIASCEANATYSGPDSATASVSRSCEDVAGNTGSDSKSFQFDDTNPSISDLGATSNPNAAQWYKAAVTNHFKAADAGSGLNQTCLDAFTASGSDRVRAVSTGAQEGSAVKVGSGTCEDVAGNVAAAIESNAFSVDLTAASSKASAPQYNADGTIDVSYTASDSGSGLKAVELWVKKPGAASFERAMTDSTPSATGSFAYAVPKDANGNYVDGTYSFYSIAVDVADNVEADPTSSDARTDQTVQDSLKPAISVSHVADGKNGWNTTAPVAVSISASDAGSGLKADPSCTDGASPLTLTAGAAGSWSASVSGEGEHAITCSVEDKAGNANSASDLVKIDTHAPALSDLGPTSQPNAAQWYKAAVTNHFKAADAGSGLNQTCLDAFPASGSDRVRAVSTGAQEGSAVKVGSGTCEDVAGNVAAAIESNAFSIDMTKPVVSYTGADREPNGNNWYNANVTAKFEAHDNLSGFGSTGVLMLLGSAVASAEGAGVTVSSPAFVDRAGNEADAVSSAAYNIDKTRPNVTHAQAPVANSYGWNKDDVTVSFEAKDNLSGFDATNSRFDADSTVENGEGAALVVSRTFTDRAGNSASDSVTVKIDRTNPTITFASRLPQANASGWNNANVTVTWDCADQSNLSGVVSASVNDIKSGEGADQSANGTCEDKAGNKASDSKGGISIDKTEPVITLSAPANGKTYKWNVAENASYVCDDVLSGTDSCSGTVANGSNFVSLPVGSKSFAVSAEDKAGNDASVSHSYNVVYNFAGYFQPIDMGGVYNSAQAGRAIPVKFKLGGDVGLDIFATTTTGLKYPTSSSISCSSTATTDLVEETITASTSGLKYDALADQYVYTWKTDSTWAGKCRQLNVKFKDGTTAPIAYFKFTK